MARKLNQKLADRLGFEVRRAGAEQKVEFHPPADPAVDRLLRRPVFIMSPVRSGSTLLRLILNAHSQLHAPHESHFRRLTVACSTPTSQRAIEALGLDRGELEHLLWDRVLHRELVRSGKSVIVEKTPNNVFAFKRIAACWPDARFLFLLRHPASIAASLHEANPEKRTWEQATARALKYMRATQRARKTLPGHTVRYEELTSDPESTVKAICGWLDIDWEPGMLQYGGPGEGELQRGLGDWSDKITSGTIQPGRTLPEAEAVPESLHKICKAWGYPI